MTGRPTCAWSWTDKTDTGLSRGSLHRRKDRFVEAHAVAQHREGGSQQFPRQRHTGHVPVFALAGSFLTGPAFKLRAVESSAVM